MLSYQVLPVIALLALGARVGGEEIGHAHSEELSNVNPCASTTTALEGRLQLATDQLMSNGLQLYVKAQPDAGKTSRPQEVKVRFSARSPR